MLDGLRRDVQALTDFPVGETLQQFVGDLGLAIGERPADQWSQPPIFAGRASGVQEAGRGRGIVGAGRGHTREARCLPVQSDAP